jgi:hypothetical protein
MLPSTTGNTTLKRIRSLALDLFLDVVDKVLVIVSFDIACWEVFADDVPAGGFCRLSVYSTYDRADEAVLTVLSRTTSSSTANRRSIAPNQLREMSCSFTETRFIPVVLLSLEAPTIDASTRVGISSREILARGPTLEIHWY